MSAANFPGHEVLEPIAHGGSAPQENAIHARHVVQFYADDAFLVDELSRYIGSALAAGDGAIVIATKAHRDGISQRLKARVRRVEHGVRRKAYPDTNHKSFLGLGKPHEEFRS